MATEIKFTVIRTGNDEDTRKSQEWFRKHNPGKEPTGEKMVIDYPDGSGSTEIIYKGKFTSYGEVRDCGNHYIYAALDSYYWIDKKTLEVTAMGKDF